MTGTQDGYPEAGTDAEATEEGFSSWLAQPAFIKLPGIPVKGVTLPTMGWILPYQS